MNESDRRFFVAAPCTGIFTPQRATVVTTEGEVVCAGQLIGAIESDRETVSIVAGATGFLELLHPGGSVETGDLLAVVGP